MAWQVCDASQDPAPSTGGFWEHVLETEGAGMLDHNLKKRIEKWELKFDGLFLNANTSWSFGLHEMQHIHHELLLAQTNSSSFKADRGWCLSLNCSCVPESFSGVGSIFYYAAALALAAWGVGEVEDLLRHTCSHNCKRAHTDHRQAWMYKNRQSGFFYIFNTSKTGYVH